MGGSHSVKLKVLSSFRHLNIISFSLKKGVRRRGWGKTGTPGSPLPLARRGFGLRSLWRMSDKLWLNGF